MTRGRRHTGRPGRRDGRRKPAPGRARPGPGLTHDRIVTAAAALIDREGVEALSARRLAAALGCEAMSLYHHVPGMPALLDQVVDRALGRLPLPPADGPHPRRALAAMARVYLGLARTRPQTFRVMATRRWRTPAETAFQTRMVELLMRAGRSPRRALRAARLLLVYLNGAGIAMTGWALERGGPSPGSMPETLRRIPGRSSPAGLDRDMGWGAERLLAMLLPEG